MREKSAPRNFLTEEFHEVSGRFVDMISWVSTPIDMLAFRNPPPPCLQITTMPAVCPHHSSLPVHANVPNWKLGGPYQKVCQHGPECSDIGPTAHGPSSISSRPPWLAWNGRWKEGGREGGRAEELFSAPMRAVAERGGNHRLSRSLSLVRAGKGKRRETPTRTQQCTGLG